MVCAYLRAGRAVFATGSNEAAARQIGINTNLVVFAVFTLTGALTGLAATLNAVRFNQVPSNSGIGLEMKVIAAVAVGGAAITGGSATILGTVLGVILLGTVGPALTFLGVSAYWEKALQGGIILLAVSANVLAAIAGGAAREWPMPPEQKFSSPNEPHRRASVVDGRMGAALRACDGVPFSSLPSAHRASPRGETSLRCCAFSVELGSARRRAHAHPDHRWDRSFGRLNHRVDRGVVRRDDAERASADCQRLCCCRLVSDWLQAR